jgi:hypothetical protein
MLPKIKYSVPFNGDLSLMEELFATGMVYEVYCMGAEGYDFSYQCHQPGCGGKKIHDLFKMAGKSGIRINLLINSPLLSFADLEKNIDYIAHLRKEFHAFAITVSDPYQITRFRSEFPDLDLEASVIMDLDSPAKIERVLRTGVRTVNIPLSLNRQIGKLREIARLKKYYPDFKMKLMVNHVCYFDCPHTSCHYFFSEMERVLGFKLAGGIDLDKCASFSLESKELIRKPFIRPEDVTYYSKNQVGDVFKILWRHSRSPVLRRTVLSYLKKSYPGNLFDIVETHEDKLSLYCDNRRFPADFVRKVTGCDKSACVECRYCGSLGDKIIKTI